MQYIPLILVLIASLVTIVISLIREIKIIFCLKNLSIVIILFYIIGIIVKKVLRLILDMDRVSEKEKKEESTEDVRADDQIITSEKSGDGFEE